MDNRRLAEPASGLGRSVLHAFVVGVQDAAKAALSRMGDRAAVVLFAAAKGKVSMVAAFSDAVSAPSFVINYAVWLNLQSAL